MGKHEEPPVFDSEFWGSEFNWWYHEVFKPMSLGEFIGPIDPIALAMDTDDRLRWNRVTVGDSTGYRVVVPLPVIDSSMPEPPDVDAWWDANITHTARIDFFEIGDRFEPMRIEISVDCRPDRGFVAPPLSSTGLRRLNLGQAIEAARRELAGDIETAIPAAPEPYSRERDKIERRPGRPPLPIEVLGEVARVYAEAYHAGQHVQKAVAEHFFISIPAAGKRIRLAREAGLLPSTRSGYAAAGALPKQTEKGGGDGD